MTKRQQERVDLLDSGEQLHRYRLLLHFLQRARIEEGEYAINTAFDLELARLTNLL